MYVARFSDVVCWEYGKGAKRNRNKQSRGEYVKRTEFAVRRIEVDSGAVCGHYR